MGTAMDAPRLPGRRPFRLHRISLVTGVGHRATGDSNSLGLVMFPDRDTNDCAEVDTAGRLESSDGRGPILVEVISEGPHCVPCEYAIAAVEYVAEFYEGRIEVRIVETKRRADALRYLELTRINGGRLSIPSILLNDRVVFETIPGPDELRNALDNALMEWEGNR